MHDEKVRCVCPDAATHPDGDTISFAEQLTFRQLVTARKAIGQVTSENPDADVADYFGMLSEFYLLHCIARWTLRDGKQAIAVNPANIRKYLLDGAQDVALHLAEVADALFSEQLILPLVQVASGSSRATPTNGSTSPQTNGKKPKHSKQSSTSTTPMAATATTAT